MPFYRLYYHLVWATKHRQPLLTAKIEPIIHGYLCDKALNLGATVYAINGIEYHVHMVATIPPKISVSKFVGQVKAVTSTRFNKNRSPEQSFFWQNEFAAFSFDRKRLHDFVSYVERQKEHHAAQTTIPILERTEEDNFTTIQEEKILYVTEDPDWRREMMSMG